MKPPSMPTLWAVLLIMATSGLVVALPTPPKLPDAKFSKNFFVRWAPNNSRILEKGSQMQLLLNNASGAGFASKYKYLFGYVSMRIKLVANESAGTVTTFYMSSEAASNHDELDFEFLGNTTGQPYVLHTNIFANGTGDREQQIFLWFDPTTDFHTYAILWNQQQIIFYVDDVPIRVFKNSGAAYPSQPMGIFSSIWNGDDWATRGGLEKVKWGKAPFVASFRGFGIDACKFSGSVRACTKRPKAPKWWQQSTFMVQDEDSKSRLKWVQDNFMVYDYCKDTRRFPKLPAECTQSSR